MKQWMIPQHAAVITAALCVALAGPGIGAQSRGQEPNPKPQLRLRANPMFGFPPLRSVFTAELVGGRDDYEEFYCAKIEWEWGDGSTSSFSYDCDPYEPGKSEMRRRFTADHTYNVSGRLEAIFRLKQGSKMVGAARVTLQISSPPAVLLQRALRAPQPRG